MGKRPAGLGPRASGLGRAGGVDPRLNSLSSVSDFTHLGLDHVSAKVETVFLASPRSET